MPTLIDPDTTELQTFRNSLIPSEQAAFDTLSIDYKKVVYNLQPSHRTGFLFNMDSQKRSQVEQYHTDALAYQNAGLSDNSITAQRIITEPLAGIAGGLVDAAIDLLAMYNDHRDMTIISRTINYFSINK